LLQRLTLALLALALYVLHQDWWNWREVRPLVFGFLPVGLAYHAAHTLASVALMWLLCRWAWPTHTDDPEDRSA
jgi:hypothetical protein